MINIDIKKTIQNNKFSYKFETNSRKIALFGPSGSGKTTFLRLLAGLTTPDNGHININGNIFFDKKINTPIHKRKIGYLPQDYTLFPHMNIEKNILYGVKAQKIRFQKNRFKFLINKLKISNKLSYYPHEISGGERQRAAIARAFLINPTILLLDEPFSALDKNLLELVQELLEYSNVPAILVTHDLDEAINFAETIAISFNGKIIEYGKTEQVLSSPKWLQTAKILQMKNIWKLKEVRKFFPIDENKNDFDFLCLKEEDIIISNKGNLKCKILNIKKNRFNYTVNSICGDDICIRFNAPLSVIRHFNLSPGNLIYIDFHQDNLIYLKDYEKIFN